jgi:hypothetical protein
MDCKGEHEFMGRSEDVCVKCNTKCYECPSCKYIHDNLDDSVECCKGITKDE